MGLILNIFADCISGYFVTNTPDKVTVTPQFPSPKLFSQLWKPLERFTGRDTFHHLYHLCRRVSRRCLNKYVYMVFHDFHRIYPKFILLGYPPKYFFQVPRNLLTQYMLPVFRYPYQMILQIIYGMFSPSNPHATFIQEKALFKQAPLPRLTASHFPPASKLAGIQWRFL